MNKLINGTLIFFMIMLMSCQSEIEIENNSEINNEAALNNVNNICKKHNDSAVFLSQEIDFSNLDTSKYNEIISLFNLAITCDSNYFAPWYNKIVVLFNAKDFVNTELNLLKMDTIFRERNNPKIKMMLAENYFFLKDNVRYNEYKEITLNIYKGSFSKYPNQENFINYATSLCRFNRDGYNQVIENLLPENKKLFTKEEIEYYNNYFKAIDFIGSISQL